MTLCAAYGDSQQVDFFEGEVILTPKGCESQRLCKLEQSLRYTDPKGLVWLAEAGNITDGASIPTWAQPTIGSPFDGKFIKPAIIHDHYCNPAHQVRPWRDTHRVFYDALLNQGVDSKKALIMYAAVYIGGPKWRTVIKGRYCGKNCTYSEKITEKYQRTSLNSSQARIRAFNEVQKAIVASKDSLPLEDVETKIHALLKDDEYYQNPQSRDETLPTE